MRARREFVAIMAKHLPPSGACLRLLDLDGRSGAILAETRADLHIRLLDPALPLQTAIESDSVDAVVGLDVAFDSASLRALCDALRPGGRLIILQRQATVHADQPKALRQAGFTRILVEPALDETGLLLRGEKPQPSTNTRQRVRAVAAIDAASIAPRDFSGRYLHLLIQQLPNKPVWKLAPDEAIRWRAAAIQAKRPILLAFSGLPRAVAFMQAAVLQDAIRDINKVGKFSRETARSWEWGLLINPESEALRGASITYLEIDPATAEAPDE